MAITIVSFILTVISGISDKNGKYGINIGGWHLPYGTSIYPLYDCLYDLRLSRRQAKYLAKIINHYLAVGLENAGAITHVKRNGDEYQTDYRWSIGRKGFKINTRQFKGAMCRRIVSGYPLSATVGYYRRF